MIDPRDLGRCVAQSILCIMLAGIVLPVLIILIISCWRMCIYVVNGGLV